MMSLFISIMLVGTLVGSAVGFPEIANAKMADLLLLDAQARDPRRMDLVNAATGGPAHVYVEIENLGDAAAPKGTVIQCRIYEPHKIPIVQGSAKFSKPLGAFKKSIIKVRLSGTGIPGTRRLRCKLDPENKLRESNERNNIVDKELILKKFRKDAYRVEFRDLKKLRKTTGFFAGTSRLMHLVDFQAYNPGAPVPER